MNSKTYAWAWMCKSTGALATTSTRIGGWETLCTARTREVARARGVNTQTHKIVRVEIRVVPQ